MPTMIIAKQIVHTTDKHGRIVINRPGDWFEVGRQQAQQLIASGAAMLSPYVTPEYRRQAFALDHCGVLLTSDNETLRAQLTHHYPDLEIKVGKRELAWPRTLIMAGNSTIRPQLVSVGFHRLNRGWQVAAPLWRYGILARDIGSAKDKAKTEALIHDLRFPVYDVRAVFIRRCDDTQKLMRYWEKEKGDPQHAFMRALYKAKPTMCALPITWMQ